MNVYETANVFSNYGSKSLSIDPNGKDKPSSSVIDSEVNRSNIGLIGSW